MQVRTIVRTAIDGGLTVARLPIDTTTRLLPGGAGRPIAFAVDRTDAVLRGVVAGLLGDDRLREDASRRETAVAERERAARLRDSAERRRSEAAGDRKQRERKAAQVAQKRKQASRRAAEMAEDNLDEQDRRERVASLGREAEALDLQAKANTTRDESQRLRGAAERAKEGRKAS